MTFGKPRNHGCRISDEWTYKGMRSLILENELLRVTVLTDKGSDIVEFRYKPLDLDYLYLAPGGIRNPQREMPSAYTSSPYLDFFTGGWNDIIPSGGPGANYKGALIGQHGETCLVSWHCVITEDSPERVAARLWVRLLRTPYYIEKTLSMVPGQPVLTINEKVVNEGGEAMQFMWGQHIAFGRPFLEEGAVINAPAKKFLIHDEIPNFHPRRFKPGSENQWPMATTPDGKQSDASRVPAFGNLQAQEMAYLADLQSGWYAITNPIRKVGFGISFDPKVFRYIWYWQQLGCVADGYPWWSRTHTAALEPWSSYPTNGLEECIGNGTALKLEPEASLETTIRAVAFTGLEAVKEISMDGKVI
jgi:hypothetical protein